MRRLVFVCVIYMVFPGFAFHKLCGLFGQAVRCNGLGFGLSVLQSVGSSPGLDTTALTNNPQKSPIDHTFCFFFSLLKSGDRMMSPTCILLTHASWRWGGFWGGGYHKFIYAHVLHV